MKKTSFTLIIAMMAVAVLFTGCKKEELNGNGRKVTLGVRMEPGNAKSYIEGVTPKWHANDQVKVNNGTYGVTGVNGNKAQIENVTAADNYRVVFPASIVTPADADISSTVNVTLPAVQTYTEVNGVQRVDAPMGGYGTSTDLSMHNLCSILKVNVTNTRNTPMTLRKITVTAESANLSGTGTATVEGLTTDKITLNSGSTSVSLDFVGTEVIVPALGGKTFYIVAPEFDEQDVTIKVFEADGLSKKSYTNVTLAHNMITSVSVNNTNIIEGVLPGDFTVANGRKIYFSKGNLQATTSDLGANWTWSFAPYQYDYVGAATANTAISGNGTVSQNGTVDLFGWSTDATYYGIHNSEGNVYSGEFKNWGYVFGNPSPWRTLTQDEWVYLLNRTTPSGVSYAKAVVNGQNGLIILPDDWSTTYYTLESTNTTDADYTTNNNISSVTWTNNLEAHGAVFLPAAGRRAGTGVSYVGSTSYAYYWSSAPDEDEDAYYLQFNGLIVNTGGSTLRYYGMSVRLVQDAN